MDEQILKLLREHAPEFLSGEEMSRQLGVTRTAIWKRVDYPETFRIHHRGFATFRISPPSVPRSSLARGGQAFLKNKVDRKNDSLFSNHRFNKCSSLSTRPSRRRGRGDRCCRISRKGERKAGAALVFPSFPESLPLSDLAPQDTSPSGAPHHPHGSRRHGRSH